MEAGAGLSSSDLLSPLDSPMPSPSPSPSSIRRSRNIFQFPTARLPGCPQSCSLPCMQEVSVKFSLSAVNTLLRKVGTKVRFTSFCAGPVSSILVNRYGSRPVVIVGGILVSTAMVLASFGTSIIHLYLCIGVIGGKSFFFCIPPLIPLDEFTFIWIMRNCWYKCSVGLCYEWLTNVVACCDSFKGEFLHCYMEIT